MKKNKSDIITISIYIFVTILIVLLTMRGKYLYGSTLDFESQHFRIPEYFRTLFYSNFDLFPDFAFNLGGGQNIYNLSYYGLLSPIILLSYLMPQVSMLTFINVSSVLLVLISSIMFYYFLKKRGFDSKISFIGGFIFLLASPLFFHSHRHIMFVNYMPFLILGLFGIDSFIDKKKSYLLIFSVFLMIMSSYYFSVPGIITLMLYGAYRIYERNIDFKDFIKCMFKLIIPLFIGVLMSGILILPTFSTLLSNRSKTSVNIDLLDLIIPSVNNKYILYYHYGLGLTCLSLFGLSYGIFHKRKNLKYLSIILFMFIIFPVFNYIINATMYVDSKVLIPFLPLYVLVIVNCLNEVNNKNVDKKVYYLFGIIIIFALFGNYNNILIYDVSLLIIALIVNKRFKVKWSLNAYSILSIFILSISMCFVDNLITNDKNYTKSFDDIKIDVKKIINEDDDFYRISVQDNKLANINNVFDIDYYSSTIYSSLNNQLYNSYYYDFMGNEIQSRNRSIISSVNNNISLLTTSNKYIVSSGKKLIGYDFLYTHNGYNVYKSNYSLPIGYVNNNIISSREYDSLINFDKKIALHRNVIVDNDLSNNYDTVLNKLYIDINKFKNDDINIVHNNDSYILDVLNDSEIIIPLSNDLKKKIIFVSFDILESWSCKNGDLTIEINGVSNKLTCGNWKYHNNNYNFEYVIGDDNRESINIKLLKGKYNINNISVYYSDFNDIIFSDYDKFEIKKIDGDRISGNIFVNNAGYFILNIPYDNGFKIYVDGHKKDYENVNKGLIGFKIDNGQHNIEIEYEAPFKKIGFVVTIFGIISFIVVVIIEKNKRLLSI